MSDLARRLREARQQRGFSLKQAEQATKIRTRYLEAMEAGDYARLPDGLSARGFVRNYSRWLGLDFTQALNDFEVEHGVIAINATEVIPAPPSRDRRPSRFTEVMPLPEPHYTGALPEESQADLDMLADDDALPSEPPRRQNGALQHATGSRQREAREPAVGANGRPVIYVEDRRDFSGQNSSFKLQAAKTRSLGGIVDGISTFVPGDGLNTTQAGAQKPHAVPARTTASVMQSLPKISPRVLAGLGATAGALLLAYGVYSVAAPAVSGFINSSRATPAVQAAVPTVASPSVVILGTSVPSVSPTAAVPAAPAVAGQMEFVLDARERAWVRIKADDRVVFEGIAPVGAGQAYIATSKVTVETGNAGAFEAIVNGRRIGSLGPRNAIARLTYNPLGQFAVE